MTQSLQTFHRAIGDAAELFQCYENMNADPEQTPPNSIKKASLVLTLTAWETYVEDVATELFHNKFSILNGSTVGNFVEKQFRDKLKQFNTPNSAKTQMLFREFFGFDVTEHWTLQHYIPKTAKAQLDDFIKLRGEAVHRAIVDINQPDVIKKAELRKCIRFFEDLARATGVS